MCRILEVKKTRPFLFLPVSPSLLLFHHESFFVFLPFPSVIILPPFLKSKCFFHSLKFNVPQDEQRTCHSWHSLDVLLPDHFLKSLSFSNSSHFELYHICSCPSCRYLVTRRISLKDFCHLAHCFPS